MNWLPTIFRRRALEQELDKELRFHFEQSVHDKLAAGLAPDEARRQAALEFGGLEQIKESCRDERRGQWLESVSQDIHYAVRQLRKAPGFTFTVIVTLALGIGACTAIFSVVYGILVRQPPFPEPERIVSLKECQMPKKPTSWVSAPTFLDWKAEARSFAHLAAAWGTVKNLGGEAEPLQVGLNVVTAEYFTVFGVPPLLGHTFSPAEDQPGSRVIVLSHAFWQRIFGGAADIVGRSIRLDGDAYVVIGVMPPVFKTGDGWVPMGFGATPKYTRGQRYFNVFGRLNADATVQAADAEIKMIAGRLAKEYPATNAGWSAFAMSLHDLAVRGLHPMLYTLLAAVGCVLLIGCANIANLLLARATARHREMSIRAALGAGRGRLVRQLLTESMVLAVAGGVAGIGLAWASLDALLKLAPWWVTSEFPITINGAILAASVVLTLVTGLIFGLVPAWIAARIDVNTALKQATPGASQSRTQRRIGRSLVVLEVALVFMLLSAAGLLVRSFARFTLFDRGFDPSEATLLQVTLAPKKYATDQQRMNFINALHTQIERVPGVSAFGISSAFPFSMGKELRFAIPGRPDDAKDPAKIGFTSATPGYFPAMGIRLLRGRLFGSQDHRQAARVVVINETAARLCFPDEDALGRQIVLDPEKPEVCEVIGVVADTRSRTGEARPQCFGPLAQAKSVERSFFTVVRSALPASALAAALKPQVYAVDKEQPIQRIVPLYQLFEEQFGVSEARLLMALVTLFSAIATAIAAVGIFAVMAWSVAQRRTEIGVRLALGATRADILNLVMGEGARQVGLGLSIGLGGAFATSRLIEAQLFRTSGHDPLAWSIVTLLLLTIAALACFLPARRATKVDPITALRCE